MSLPSGYKWLEYIESSGTQFINTGVKAKNNTKVIAECNITYGTDWVMILGSYDTGSYFSWWANAAQIYAYYGSQNKSGNGATGKQTIIANGNKWSASANSFVFSDASFTAPSTMYLFSVHNGGNSYANASMKLYSCQIYDNGTLVRDFIPCQTTDGTIGLWDDVNSVFYGNAGTGTFTAGPVIAIAADESEIKELEYIQSSGTQHLDTLFKPNNHTRVVIDFRSTFSTANSPKGLLGSRNSSDVGMFAFLYSNRIDPNYNGVGKSVTVDSLQRHVYDFNQNSFSVDGDVVSFDAGIFSSGYNLLLLSVQNYGTIDNRKAQGYLYSCKIYDNGALIRDYIAAKLSDGTVGLYDKLNGLLYVNAGTGTFEAGPVVASPSIFVNIDGIWKPINHIYVNINNIWQKST